MHVDEYGNPSYGNAYGNGYVSGVPDPYAAAPGAQAGMPGDQGQDVKPQMIR